MNVLRTGFLLAALTGLFLAVGYLLGGNSGMFIALAFSIATNLFAYLNGDTMVTESELSLKARSLLPSPLCAR